MSEKTKIKIPKVKLGLLKNNFLIAISIVMVFVLILNFIVWNTNRKTNIQISALKNKKEKIESASRKIAKFVEAKLYLGTEEFERKVIFGAIPPIAALQQAGLIISEFSAYSSVIVNEEEGKGSFQSSDEDFISVGSRTLWEVEFEFKFSASYEDFMKILRKISMAEPLIIIKGFTVERGDGDTDSGVGDLRRLTIELKLASFAEISPDQGIWTIE